MLSFRATDQRAMSQRTVNSTECFAESQIQFLLHINSSLPSISQYIPGKSVKFMVKISF